jgi:diguanylate cyclase (GGDEF)-like protein/PAS domain S-box-containing protein
MKLFTPTRKVSLGIVLLTISLILVGDLLGVVPNEDEGLLEGRKMFCESLAVQFSLAATRGDFDLIKGTLDMLVSREDDVLSAAIRNSSNRILAEAGEHSRHWVDIVGDKSTASHVQVPVFNDNRRWGTIEIVFKPMGKVNMLLGISDSLLPLLLFLALVGYFAYLFVIKRTLRELDPRAVIPERVKSAFNALAEGLVIMDEKGQIILANKVFAEKIEVPADTLMGHKVSNLNWKRNTASSEHERLPWEAALAEEKRQIGVPMKYDTKRNGTRTFMVNSTPILDARGAVRGALSTFDDLTDLETKQIELRQTISQLKTSRKELQDKTVELEYLATRDPLTGCLNRRAFFEKAEVLFLKATQNGTDIACIMADIDHFKSVNDRYGHATGDKVIQLVSGEFRSNARPDDLVGRYGGEEFCIIMPGASCATAVAIAERLRTQVKQSSQGHFTSAVRITASFGVAILSEQITSPSEVIDLADKALYVAKENGRNRVVAWDDSLALENGEAHDHQTSQGVTDVSVESGPLSDDINRLVASENQDVAESDLHSLKNRITELEEDLAYSQETLTQRDGQDAVTGLPNRLLFHDRVSQALAQGQRYDRIAAIIVFDIDMFQRINDALGLVIGNSLLKKAAERLVEILRDTDTVALLDGNTTMPTVSRTGADEFGILLTDLKDVDMVTWIVKRILDSMSVPLEIDGHEIFITCSAGISLYPHDGDSPDTLLQNANAARFSAKQRLGRNNFVFYSADLNQESYKHLWFESQLHHALDRGELYLHYQPKVDLKTGRITSMEALVRWTNEKLGFVSPGDFIPVAERTGLINAIGEWVMRTACNEAKRWADAGFADVGIAVNLSASQFRQKDLYGQITTMLAEIGLEPRLLEVEITETTVMENFETAIKMLKELTSTGIHLSVDDFGTGYSSLAYLKHLPLNTLKIDRSFLSDTVPDQQDKLIISAIIAMAHSMGLCVVAEGVESHAQKAFLAGLGCDEMQGFLFSKPVPESEAIELLRIHNGEDAGQKRARKTA